MSPKVLIFHKEANNLKTAENMKDMQLSQPAKAETPKLAEDTQTHIKQIQELLKKTAVAEEDVANKMR